MARKLETSKPLVTGPGLILRVTASVSGGLGPSLTWHSVDMTNNHTSSSLKVFTISGPTWSRASESGSESAWLGGYAATAVRASLPVSLHAGARRVRVQGFESKRSIQPGQGLWIWKWQNSELDEIQPVWAALLRVEESSIQVDSNHFTWKTPISVQVVWAWGIQGRFSSLHWAGPIPLTLQLAIQKRLGHANVSNVILPLWQVHLSPLFFKSGLLQHFKLNKLDQSSIFCLLACGPSFVCCELQLCSCSCHGSLSPCWS